MDDWQFQFPKWKKSTTSKKVRLLQTEEGGSDAKQPKRMMTITGALEAKHSKCFKKNEMVSCVNHREDAKANEN